MSRTVMDFYTIARIIKSKNKNIIIYAGNDHTERIIYILNKYFVFEVKKQILGKSISGRPPPMTFSEDWFCWLFWDSLQN